MCAVEAAAAGAAGGVNPVVLLQDIKKAAEFSAEDLLLPVSRGAPSNAAQVALPPSKRAFSLQRSSSTTTTNIVGAASARSQHAT